MADEFSRMDGSSRVEWLMNFHERMAQAVQTADEFSLTDGSSRWNG